VGGALLGKFCGGLDSPSGRIESVHPKDRPSDRAAGVALGEGNGFGPLSSGTGVYSVFSALKKEFEEEVEPSDIAVCCAKDGFQCALKA